MTGSEADDSDTNNGENAEELDVFELDDGERRERSEWQEMLTAALMGEVVDSEKKRLNTQPDNYLFNLTDTEYAENLSELLQNRDFRTLFKHIHTELWVGVRAAIRGRTPLQEKQTLESLRAFHTDNAIRAVIDFNADRVVGTTEPGDEGKEHVDFSKECLVQVMKLLRRVDYVEGMYPTLRSLGEAKPVYASRMFQEKLAAITSWTNISERLNLLFTMLQRWTGSSELNLSKGGTRSVHPGNGEKEFQHTPFVERLLKENGMKMIFEQNILTELETVMTSARRDLMKHAAISNEMGLPLTSSNMQALLRFPPRLLQTCLQIRLQSAENLNNPAPAQVDQLLEDFRDALSVACRVKRSFIALAKPTEQWSTGVELDPEYDKTLRSCLQTYFRLLHRKLVNSGKQGSNKDFEVLESQWPFLQEIVRDIDGGQYELALRYCQQAKYHVRIWTRLLARMLKGPPTYDSMSSQDLGKWLSRALQAIRPPILKGQRLVRTIQNAVANSTDYEFDDPFPLLAQLSRGVYVIGSQSLLQKPHLARQLLAACIVDETLTAEEYRDCYVLVVRTDAEFSWTGTSIAPEGGEIPFQDLELSPGQMRLISPGIARLDRHRQWLERINIAAKRPSWDTATTVTDEIIGNLVKGADGRQRARRARKHDADAAYLAVPALTCRGASCDLLELVQEAFLFVSNTASRGSRFLDLKAERYIRLALLHMCVGWCGFITEDCMANEKRTFRWAVQALEFTMRVTKHNTVQVLPPDDWQLIKSHVAGCLTLMISHFDILGARNEETKKNKQRQREKEQELRRMDDPNALLSLDGIGANFRTQLLQKQREQHAYQLDTMRDYYLAEEGKIGRMLEVTARPEDQTLRLLAASSSNITIRWQIGRYIGGGSFGSVYVGYNLDTGELMAVKEIRFPTRPIERAHDNPGSKIVREMEVMSMLQHPNIVTYYGIEVHREKVYLFMELCTKGSLSQVIKDQCGLDEDTAKVYVVQMLQGLKYLHESGICHRDIKCDNTLLDESMNIKLVDFGAAKVLNQQSLAATRRTRMGKDGGASLTGTPMYMAPEVILGSNKTLRPGKLGAQDIWSLGCCIVEMITGTPPWAHLDNEWAIMYHVVAGNPPLPDPSMISSEGMRFIKRCFTRQPADRPQASDLLKDEWV
ncbi:hypothetical protein GQ54DRAFT_265651, partial [Martensiomyces pterosporus]